MGIKTEQTVDDNMPVLVGCSQLTQTESDPALAQSPMALTADAAFAALRDTGIGDTMLAQLDTIAVIRSFSDTSWRFACPFGQVSNPPASLAGRLGASSAARLIYTEAGGNMPQWCVNRLGEMISRGEVGSALIAGGEALATQKAAQRAGLALDWAEETGGKAQSWGVPRRGWSDLEDRHGMRGAIYAYPLFEQAIRGALGRSLAAHQSALGELLAHFAAVAAANPLADRRDGFSANEISQAHAGNPYIGFPYTRLMNANAFIDQSAALIMTSVGRARALGIPRDRWVFLHGYADAHDHWFVTDRRDFHSSPAMTAVFAAALEMADVSIDQIDQLDLYSCFSSAVEVACSSLGIASNDSRGLTITGGLPYFGGPGNNYVTHSIAQMMTELRQRPGKLGLVTANGNYLTKHSAGVYSTEPPAGLLPAPADLQPALDQGESPVVVPLADGTAQVETWTVMNDRQGPSQAIVIGRLSGGERFIANTPEDADLLHLMQNQDLLGVSGRVSHDGTTNLFVPQI
ncbi:MAG: acetyl-CoA acetyltransferase [Burkholderiaceae bacterium]